jgi:gliding motility-associated lipoprotein GldH
MTMRKSRTITYLSLALVLLPIVTSCGKQSYYDEAYSFEDNSWSETDTAHFEIDVDDTIQPFNFIMTLRTSTQYQFSNIWVYVVSEAPDSTKSKVAQRIPLARPDGSWIGRVSGTIVESKLRFDSKIFPMKGKYTFDIVNATQQENIEEVLDISLRVEKAN